MTHVVEGPSSPDLLRLHAADPQRFPCLLESAAAHPATGRHDLLLMAEGVLPTTDADPFVRLDAAMAALPATPAHPSLPFVGGYAFYLGYEASRWVEPSTASTGVGDGLPEAQLLRCPAALIHDRQTGRSFAVSEYGKDHAQTLLDALARAPAQVPRTAMVATALRAEPPEQFYQGVQRIKAYLMAGDVFQVNLSRRWEGHLHAGARASDVYAALRQANPAPFAALWQGDGWAVVSSSPERLVGRQGERVETRPIAGTRPRHDDALADRSAIVALRASGKERAEHIMLIDLERNDLGRVCRPGSVVVDEMMTVESYRHVHHLVSSVTGQLRPGIGPGSLLRAVFPGGTITGCPKVRCMHIIDELESGPRGAYTGSIGYVSRCGRMDSNILIRTLTLSGPQISLRAGAGIVADSDPMAELRETEAKAMGLLRALGVAEVAA
jgi:anthranilate synthase component I